MRSRRLWWLFGAVCVFAIVLGYLARGTDDYAALRRFNPRERWGKDWVGHDEHVLRFESDYGGVAKALGLDPRVALIERKDYGTIIYISKNLPSGKDAYLSMPTLDEPYIELHVEESQPWLLRTWDAIKQRIGL